MTALSLTSRRVNSGGASQPRLDRFSPHLRLGTRHLQPRLLHVERGIAGRETVRGHLSRLEGALKQRGNDGPYFNDDKISLVDAAYGPFFMRFSNCDKALQTGLLDEFPLVKTWSEALLSSDAVTGSVPPEFPEAFEKNIEGRGALAWQIMQGAQAAE